MDSYYRDWQIEDEKNELHYTLNHKKYGTYPILIFANKQDLSDIMSLEEIREHLELDKFKDRKIYIQPASAFNGEGLHEGLTWLVNCLQNS